MIQTSEAFKQAVLDNKLQRCLFLFSDAFFTNEDVLLSNGGVHFSEPFVTEKDLAIGQCPSARLTFTLNNEQSLLENYQFGDFHASIGVLIEKTAHSTPYKVEAILTQSERLTVRADGLYINDMRCSAQPFYRPDCLLVNEDTVYAWQNGLHGWMATIADGDLADGQEIETNPFMERKMRGFAGRGIVKRGNIITECSRGCRTIWEYAPLGLFIATRPNVTRKKTINVQCSDKMTMFDFEMTEISISYPITHRGLAQALCSHVGVVLDDAAFINQDKVISKAPDDFKSATARDALGWIAEAACANARMSREGTLVFDWFHQTDVIVTENMRTSYEQYWYETLPIDKLVVRNYDSEKELQLGDGENGLLIENNPMLRQDDKLRGRSIGAADTEGDPIYERLSQVETYHPGTARTFVDWSVQAGDVVSVKDDNVNYPMPVYTLDVQWAGSPITTMSATGEQKRKRIKTREQRQSYSIGAAGYRRTEDAKDEFRTAIDQQDTYIDLIATAITGKDTTEEEKKQALLKITADGFLQTVSNNGFSSLLLQTVDGFVLKGDKIVLKGLTMFDTAEGTWVNVYGLGADHISVEEDLYSPTITCDGLTCSGDMTVTTDITLDGLSLANHAHQITADDDGTVTIGTPTEDPQSANFNIANTNFFKREVALAKQQGASNVYVKNTDVYDEHYNTTYKTISASLDVILNDNRTSTHPISVDASAAWQKGYDTGKAEGEGGTVVSGDIQLDSFTWYDSNSTANLSSYTTLNSLATIIREHKNGQGYATFRANVKGARKYYKIPIG